MNATEYPAISLHRPWAIWVREGWKTIETRRHDRFKNLVGKRIAIHAAQKWDDDARTTALKWLDGAQHAWTGVWKKDDAYRGRIVALATVDGTGWLSSQASHERAAMIECRTARFGLYLTDIQPIEGPFVRGQQGIFRVTI